MKLGRRPRFVGRGRERALWLLLAAVLFVVLWAIAQVLGWPLWARAVFAGLAAAAPLVIAELRARAGQDDTWARLVEQRVAVSGGPHRLPRVRAVGLDQLRVHAARVQVPYIERDQQDKLEESVGPGLAALVVGHSMSGKTRLAAEVVKRKFPKAQLLSAESGKALRELFDGGLDPAGIVVWLDDLERFLGTDGLTIGLLNRLTSGRAIVVATIRVEQRETYRPGDKLRPPEWEVLQRFNEISLERRLTDPELVQVRETVSDPGVLAAVDHYGLAEYLGAGPEAVDKFDKGEIANPVGQALVRAAVDWRRSGLIRPASREILAKALLTYLTDRPDVSITDQAIDGGLAWATAKINETVALLGQVYTGSNGPVFEAFDYLIDQLIRTSTPVPDPMWALALEQAGFDELPEIGLTAYGAGNLATAETAWRHAAAKGDSKVASWAALSLGQLFLEPQGDVEGAKAAYQRAIDSGHAAIAPSAALSLGQLLHKQGDLEGAQAAFRQAIASGHADEAPQAALFLGLLLAKQGDVEGAKVAYQQAIASGHPKWAPGAARYLGLLLAKQGDVEGAKVAYQRAITSQHADEAPMAALGLGLLLAEQGDVEEAKAAYQRAITSQHADVTPWAAVVLGDLLEEQGDVEGAKAAYRQAIASGHADLAPKASRNLGLLLREQGDLAGAKAAYRRAIDSGHPKWAPEATLFLGMLLAEQGDLEGAKAACQRAIDSGHADAAPAAAVNLGMLLQKQGDIAGATAAYQRAIDSGHAEFAPMAARNLERLLRDTPPPPAS